ncbi:SIR2-like protein [Blastococcus colisei]|uniref:SIR2-like protein n=1 Tax=Blastococcus colisei TaxID=1564162 RepID=A0A543PFQ5_9ACTN|nr:CHAT domain-containing protein [Blastococcus colisei]TQN42912.1 SIR2-like protein [Blastococcus colisei]
MSLSEAPGLVADLEIGLHRRGEDEWMAELRFSSSERGTIGTDILTSGPVDVDLTRLATLHHGGPLVTRQYGQLLSDGLFASSTVRQEFAKARTTAARGGIPLRLRLLIAPSAPELHALRWETLLDPDSGTPLLTDSNVLFSRYLTSTDWRPVRMRLRSELRALIVVADPVNLQGYAAPGADPDSPERELAPVDVAGELQRAKASLGPIRTDSLAGTGRATLSNLVGRLRDGYDVVYLVCHGYLVNGEPQLVLEHENGSVHVVPGRLMIQRLKELNHLPRLIVLASCHSASDGGTGTHDDGAVSAIGPQLVELGVPAVLAMQGDISVGTVEGFVPAFFTRLQEHGRIDQAMTEARAGIRDRSDWWAPALFMRLHSGRLWYAAGFGRGGFTKWPALVNDIWSGSCLPLLGPGMTDTLLGPRQQLARDLADRYGFPLAPYYREDLPQVAQFLAVDQARDFPVAKLREYLIVTLSQRLRELSDTAGEPMPPRFVDIPRSKRTNPALANALIDDMTNAVWDRLHAPLDDPFAVLARLDVPLFVTAQPLSLLTTALKAEGKRPQVELARWNRKCPRSIFETMPDYEPTPEEPLVFHIFGSLQHPGSIVLSEDNYFEFLRTTGRDPDAIPELVRSAFADSALLFLGFRMEDWDFRVLFHSIMSQEGGDRLEQHSHVAAQIDPEEGLTLEPDGARRYFESYFRSPHSVNVYWGSVETFLGELRSHVEGDV